MSFDVYLRKNAVDSTARRLAERAIVGSVVGTLNSMREKYRGNRGEGFASGVGAALGGYAGADLANLGIHYAAAKIPLAKVRATLGTLDNPTAGGLAVLSLPYAAGAAGAYGGYHAGGALYNKLRGKKHENKNKGDG